MSKSAEFRITIAVPVPDDHFERADVLSKIRPAIEAMQQALPDDARVEHKLVAGRIETKPRQRKPKADKPALAAAE